jgi:hypothetical protein
VTREIFPVILAFMPPWMETGAGPVELLIGLDNQQWLPIHIEDSWDPDDDMRPMKSAFGHRFMITDGWGRSLLPPEAPAGEQEGAAGGATSGPEEAQEVQLEEYQGWSQGTLNRGGGTSPRCPDTQRPRLPYWNPGEDSYQEAITPERENSPRPWAERSPRVPAGQGTLPRLGCRTSLPVSRAARIAVDMGRAGVELSGLSKCEGSHILIPGECCPAPASRTCGHYAAVGTHDGCHGARYAASA